MIIEEMEYFREISYTLLGMISQTSDGNTLYSSFQPLESFVIAPTGWVYTVSKKHGYSALHV